MKVREIIELLGAANPDAEVYIGTDTQGARHLNFIDLVATREGVLRAYGMLDPDTDKPIVLVSPFTEKDL